MADDGAGVAYVGRERDVGAGRGFLWAWFFSPLVGFIVALSSRRVDPRAAGSSREARRALFKRRETDWSQLELHLLKSRDRLVVFSLFADTCYEPRCVMEINRGSP